jgi:hypothetical protein
MTPTLTLPSSRSLVFKVFTLLSIAMLLIGGHYFAQSVSSNQDTAWLYVICFYWLVI